MSAMAQGGMARLLDFPEDLLGQTVQRREKKYQQMCVVLYNLVPRLSQLNVCM